MKQKDQTTQPIIGFFVAFADEAKKLKKSNLVNAGRSGVFYKKEDLVTTLGSNTALNKDKNMDIFEIEVPPCAIISPNCIKFGIKGGKNIPIINVQSFKKALKEMMAVA